MDRAAKASVRTVTKRLTRGTRPAPKIRKRLRSTPEGLPIPHVNIVVRDTHPSRLSEHYHHTLSDDLLYMTYKHEHLPRGEPRKIRPLYDPEDPYTKHRKNPLVGGPAVALGRREAPPTTAENVVKLERIVLHTFQKGAVKSKQNLLGPIMMMRALSGMTENGGGRHKAKGVEIVVGKQSVSGWVRPGVPAGAKVELKGPKMYEFLGTLTEFVLPRLRDFQGFSLPAPSAQMKTPSGTTGVVEFGLPPEAMGLFPQIEVNLDSYPGSYGFNLHFITNAVGQNAQMRARQLLSGFGVPFVRK